MQPATCTASLGLEAIQAVYIYPRGIQLVDVTARELATITAAQRSVGRSEVGGQGTVAVGDGFIYSLRVVLRVSARTEVM